LQYVFGYTHGSGGGFGTDVAESGKLICDLEAAFPIRTRFGATEIFETENILVCVGASIWAPANRLEVHLARPVPREAVPAFLWNYTRRGGSFHGMFTPER